MSVRRVRGELIGKVLAVVFLAAFAVACHNNSTSTAITVTVTSSCSNVTVPLQGTCQFSAAVANATDTTVTWQVNMVTGGTTTCGTISANGLYTAPSVLPSSSACSTITITAVSNQNNKATGNATVTLTSGIAISITPTGTLTVGTGEMVSFVATVTGTGTNFVNTVNWSVNGTQGGSSTTGTITMTTPGDGVTPAVFMAPGTAPSSAVTIQAQSVADTTQIATASVTVTLATTPELDGFSPTVISQGALFEDLYLTGTGFLSTTTVKFAGQVVSSVGLVSSTVLRARVPSTLLSDPASICLQQTTTPVTYRCSIAVANQLGAGTNQSSPPYVTVVPVRPAALTVLPSTYIQQPSPNGASPIEVDGGYYAANSVLSFNGQPRVTTQSGQTISSITRSANGTVTATLLSALTVPGGNGVGLVTVTGVADASFDGTFLVLAGSGTATLHWNQTGSPGTSAGGTVTNVADPRSISASIGGISNDLTTAGLYSVSVSTPNAVPPSPPNPPNPPPYPAATNVTVRPTAVPLVSNTITSQLSAPVAIAYDEVLGLPVVVNQAKGISSLAFLDSAFTTVTSTIQISASQNSLLTGVAVDSLHHIALVVDQGGQAVQAVDLVGRALVGTPLAIPAGQGPPYAVGVDNVHQLALVVGGALTGVGSATLLDTSGLSMTSPTGPTILGTVAVTTGTSPQVAVLPELGWAIVTPGGSGPLTVVDLVRSVNQGTVVFTALLGSTVQGIALDTETKTLLLADPAASAARLFRLTDQSPGGVNLALGNTAAAVNSLTRIGVVVNPGSQSAFVIDMSGPSSLPAVPLSISPQAAPAVVFAQGPNKALVTDNVNNSVTVIDFGPTRATGGAPQILAVGRSKAVTIAASPSGAVEAGNTVTITTTSAHGLTTGDSALISGLGTGYNGTFLVTVTSPTQFTYFDAAANLAASGGGMAVAAVPDIVFTSNQPVPLTVVGAGFGPQAQVRLDGVGSPTVTTTRVNSQMLTAMIPVSFLNGGPRRIVVDVEDPSTGAFSNVKNIYVAQAVSVGNSPAGVAVDVQRDLALVVNTADNTMSLVDIHPGNTTFGTVTSTVSVGTAPVSVAVLTRLGRAVIANSGEGTAAVIDETSSPPTLLYRVTVGAQPAGVAVDQGQGMALVTSSASNSASLFSMTGSSAPQPSATSTGNAPVAVAIAPELEMAAVANQTGGTVQIFALASGVPIFQNQLTALHQPAGVDYDPVNQAFLVLDRAQNAVLTVNPSTLAITTIQTGVDPSSLAYNFQSSTLLTLNTASNTLSVVDLVRLRVVDVLPLSGSSRYALAIHPRLSLVVVSDSQNNRVLLMPTPR